MTPSTSAAGNRPEPRYCIACALCVIVAMLWAGCDTGPGEDASVYRRLTGTWDVVQVDAAGTDYTFQVNQRYDSLRVTFEAADAPADRAFRLVGRGSDSRSDVATRGFVALDVPTDRLIMGGFSRDVVWTYEFETSRRVTLTSRGGEGTGTAVFLDLILPGVGWGPDPRATVQLRRL